MQAIRAPTASKASTATVWYAVRSAAAGVPGKGALRLALRTASAPIRAAAMQSRLPGDCAAKPVQPRALSTKKVSYGRRTLDL